MSFFKQHASISGEDFPVAEDGFYKCKLKEIVVSEEPSPFKQGEMNTRFRWDFYSVDATDEEGDPYKFIKYTGAKFGDDRAELTRLIDGMVGRRITPDEFLELDLDELKAKAWNVNVEAVPSKKTPGKMVNVINSVKPFKKQQTTMGDAVTAKAKVAQSKVEPEADEDNLTDPFEEG